MSQLEVDKVIPQSGTTLTLGESGDTITVPSGATLDSQGTEIKTNKISPSSSTTLTLGDSGDTITIPSGATFSATLTAPVIDEINDNNGNEEIIFTTTASAVNELTIANAATGNAPEIAATGSDTNIDLRLNTKGTGGVVFNAGAVGTPSITTTGDTNTGIFFPAADTIAFTEGGTEAMRINSSGVVLIGGTSIYSGAGPELHVEGDIDLGNGGTATERELTFSRSATTGVIGRINSRIAGFSTMPMIEFGCTNTGGGAQAGDLKFYTTSSATRTLQMWITDVGQLVIPGVYNDTTGDAANLNIRSDGLTRRSTSSARYKNTITNATHGLNELLQLRPVTFKSNNDGDTIFGGLIAEEVHDVGLTEFVEYDSENKPDALRYPHMVSICVKAIQEQQTIIEELKTTTTSQQNKIDALEARITTLENN